MSDIIVHQIKNTIFNSNTYIVLINKLRVAWLVDIGDYSSVESLLRKDIDIKGVFITHSHFDHIYGLNELIDCFPDCLVYVSEEGKKGLYSDKMNYSFYNETPFIYKGFNVSIVKDNDSIRLIDDYYMTIYETKGHDMTSMCFKVENYLFTGDTLIPNVKTITNLKGSSKDELKKSHQKLKTIISSDTIICPGHGQMLGNYIIGSYHI